MGHSIGAYIALEILKEFPSQVGSVYDFQGTFLINDPSLFPESSKPQHLCLVEFLGSYIGTPRMVVV